MKSSTDEITSRLNEISSGIDAKADSLAIILAAGHGKRIKSETSKMLHEIWGVPTVVRVSRAAADGLGTDNQILVVGIKAVDVAEAVGEQAHLQFVFQEEQHGTGDAVRIALRAIPDAFGGDIYVFPGDMGLLSAQAVRKFKKDFQTNPCDMMVLTGVFDGDPQDNYYGRILRVPAHDAQGNDSGGDYGKVIEIKEHKDILALKPKEKYEVNYNGRTYQFTRDDLLAIREFNTGVYAFKGDGIRNYIDQLDTDNVQGELYLTDLIRIFNRAGLTVKAAEAVDNRTVLGFNVKSVLKEMEVYAREHVYDQLKDLITIKERDDFYIADKVVQHIIELDKQNGPLDIFIGKGVHIESGVKLNKGVQIKNHAHLTGNVVFGENVVIHENVSLSTYPEQQLEIGRNTEILQGDIIKGNLKIGENCRIESSVNITGSDAFPTRIGQNVKIKGTSYIFGSLIEDDLFVEHSVLKCKKIRRIEREDGTVQPVRYFLPDPEGEDSVTELNN